MTYYNSFCLSQTGKSHIKAEIPCQDFSAIEAFDNKVIIAAADGLGSCKHSDLGSKAAVKKAIRLLKNGIPAEDVFRLTKEHLHKLSRRLKIDIKEFSTTLQTAAIDLDAKSVVVAIIGDGGAVVTSDVAEEHMFVFDEYVGEYCNQTQHLLIDNLSTSIKLKSFQNPIHVSLFTDGVRSVVVDEVTKTAFTPFWNAVIMKQKDVSLERLFTNILNHPRVSEKTDDDLTLASFFLIK